MPDEVKYSVKPDKSGRWKFDIFAEVPEEEGKSKSPDAMSILEMAEEVDNYLLKKGTKHPILDRVLKKSPDRPMFDVLPDNEWVQGLWKLNPAEWAASETTVSTEIRVPPKDEILYCIIQDNDMWQGKISNLIYEYFVKFPDGGNLAPIFLDNDIGDLNIGYCLGLATAREDKEGKRIIELMIQMSQEQRGWVVNNREDF